MINDRRLRQKKPPLYKHQGLSKPLTITQIYAVWILWEMTCITFEIIS